MSEISSNLPQETTIVAVKKPVNSDGGNHQERVRVETAKKEVQQRQGDKDRLSEYILNHSVPEGFEDIQSLPDVEPFECIDVPVGAYAIFDPEKPTPIRPRQLKTTGYTDCVSALACVIDSTGKPLLWGLGHISMKYDPGIAVQVMEQALRSNNPNLWMLWDLVGGRTNKDWEGAGDFAQSIFTAVDRLSNVTVNNLLFDPRANGEIAVDLTTGKKFVGFTGHQDITSNIIDYIRYELYKGQHKLLFLNTYDANPKIPSEGALPRYEWEDELPDLQDFWRDQESRKQIIGKMQPQG